MYNLWPTIIKYLPGKHIEFAKRIDDVKNFILEKVKEHQKSLDPANPRDYIDCFLSKIEEVQDTGDLFSFCILALLKVQENDHT